MYHKEGRSERKLSKLAQGFSGSVVVYQFTRADKKDQTIQYNAPQLSTGDSHNYTNKIPLCNRYTTRQPVLVTQSKENRMTWKVQQVIDVKGPRGADGSQEKLHTYALVINRRKKIVHSNTTLGYHLRVIRVKPNDLSPEQSPNVNEP